MTSIAVYVRKFKLGTKYDVILFGRQHNDCMFIKTTRKGFNFLSMSTKSCLLMKHLYSKGFSGRELPDISYILKNDLYFFVPVFLTAKTSKIEDSIEGSRP